MSDPPLPDAVAKYAGLVMTQAASIASILGDGELICPFAIVAKGDDRQSIAFEADSQEQALARGWESFEKYRDAVDLWALAREGLVSSDNGKQDVLVVAAWTRGMDEPVLFTLRFLPKAKGGFALLGPLEVQSQPPSALQRIAEQFLEGVHAHPKGHLWSNWYRHDA